QGRSHGNITASNILLTGTARLRDSGALLSDFSVEKKQNYAGDVHAFALTMYQLVRRREVQHYDWPIARSVEWNNLGPKGEATRNLPLSSAEMAALEAGSSPSEAAAKGVQEAKTAFETWDARKAVSDGYDELAGRGWTLPAGTISRLRGGVAPGQPVLPQL